MITLIFVFGSLPCMRENMWPLSFWPWLTSWGNSFNWKFLRAYVMDDTKHKCQLQLAGWQGLHGQLICCQSTTDPSSHPQRGQIQQFKP
jgi:hypothetical protein